MNTEMEMVCAAQACVGCPCAEFCGHDAGQCGRNIVVGHPVPEPSIWQEIGGDFRRRPVAMTAWAIVGCIVFWAAAIAIVTCGGWAAR